MTITDESLWAPAAEPDAEPLLPTDPGTAAEQGEHDVHDDARGGDPAWARPALIGLLATTAVLYLWGLGRSGWANAYYSAAVQAGSHSWKAFLFGSSDAGNFITVDKSPLFLWPMEISARIFGVSSWSILVPQALEGVAAVGVLYLAVRRWHGPAAGLIAGAVLALTPVAALMFRYNNPDAMLTLLLTLAAYALIRAIESGSTKWAVAAGSLVGWAFLAKMLQALLVVPGFALVFLIAAPGTLWKRARQLLLAGAALVVSAGWWVALVELWPAGSRPYVGGSQHNSVLELIFGYNGFGRLTGNETGSVGGGAAGTSGRWGATGWTRLFNADYGGQISWLLPAALVLLAAMVALTGRAPRTDRTRAGALIWGGWLLVTGAAISLGEGIIHTYYTIVLAPAIGALVGIGATWLWKRRHDLVARLVLAGTIALSGWWADVLLSRSPDWHPELRPLVLVAAFVAGAAVLVAHRAPRLVQAGTIATGLVVALAAPVASTWSTVQTPHTGALPSAGPAVTAGFGGPGAGPGTFNGPPPGDGGFNRGGNAPTGGPHMTQGTGTGPRGGFTGGGAAGGGILDAGTPSSELTTALQKDADQYTWVAAVVSANQAAGYQLAADEPVMAIGGFNGSDPAPSLEQFQQYVAEGRIHWFIAGGRGGLAGGGSTSSEISSWVEANFTATTVGGVTLYDLTSPGS